jgi:hypothetical protein
VFVVAGGGRSSRAWAEPPLVVVSGGVLEGRFGVGFRF